VRIIAGFFFCMSHAQVPTAPAAGYVWGQMPAWGLLPQLTIHSIKERKNQAFQARLEVPYEKIHRSRFIRFFHGFDF